MTASADAERCYSLLPWPVLALAPQAASPAGAISCRAWRARARRASGRAGGVLIRGRRGGLGLDACCDAVTAAPADVGPVDGGAASAHLRGGIVI